MVGTKKITNNNRVSIILQLAKDDAGKLLKLSVLSNEELAKQLAGQNIDEDTSQQSEEINSLWGNILSSFSPTEKTDLNQSLFNQTNNNTKSISAQGLMIEKSQTNNLNSDSTKKESNQININSNENFGNLLKNASTSNVKKNDNIAEKPELKKSLKADIEATKKELEKRFTEIGVNKEEISEFLLKIKTEDDVKFFNKLFKHPEINNILKIIKEPNGIELVKQLLSIKEVNKTNSKYTPEPEKESGNLEKLKQIKNIEEGLKLVDDSNIKQKIMQRLKDISKSGFALDKDGRPKFESQLSEVEDLLDAYKTCSGKETCFDLELDENKPNQGKAQQYYNYLKEHAPEKAAILLERIKAGYNNQQDSSSSLDWKKVDDNLVNDFLAEMRFEKLKKYTKTYQNDEAKYLYEKYYLTSLPPEAREKCQKITTEFGTKVYLSSDKNTYKELDIIYSELSQWKKASDGKAIIPPNIDLSKADIRYANGTCDGHAEAGTTKAIYLDGASCSEFRNSLRHELMHINDPYYSNSEYGKESFKNINEITAKKIIQVNGRDVEDIDMKNCKHWEEFLNAGVHPALINYAYTNPQEFLAVAAQGDCSKYSPEFKKLLVDLGFPEWAFKIKPDEKTEKRAELTQELKKKYPERENLYLISYVEYCKQRYKLPADEKDMYNRALSYIDQGLSIEDATLKVKNEILAESQNKKN